MDLKFFQYQFWTLLKRSEKKLSSKRKFSSFLQVDSSNITLKLC